MARAPGKRRHSSVTWQAYSRNRLIRGRRTENTMWRFIGILLVVWLAVTLIGAVVKGLFWLAVVGLLFFAATAALGWNKRRELPRR